MASSYGSNATTGVPEIKHGVNTVITADQATSKAKFPTGVVAATATGEPVVYEQVLGIGQTWQDVTASRALATNYLNNSSKPRLVSVQVGSNGASVFAFSITVNGVVVCAYNAVSDITPVDRYSTLTTFVPPLGSFRVDTTNGVKLAWSELK